LSLPTSKITIVGCGAIGTTIAYSLFTRRPGLDLVLRNRDEKKAQVKAFDISHCGPGKERSAIRAGSIDDTAGSDVVVVTAGVLPKEDGKRSDVLRDNIEIYRELIPPLAARSPNAVFIVVTNPVDSMAYAAYRLAGAPASRVLGSGTILDGTRLRTFIGQAYDLDPAKIEADIVGEHGDTMVPLWSGAAYAGRPLAGHLGERGIDFGSAAKEALLEKTRRAGWEIRLAGEHSCYGISFAALRAVESVLGYSKEPLTVSSYSSGGSGQRDLYMSLPAILGRGGIASRSTPPTSEEERVALLASADALRAQMDMVDRQIGARR
jgi:L-lactate dehydrogenase